jgi:hypothetical protein
MSCSVRSERGEIDVGGELPGDRWAGDDTYTNPIDHVARDRLRYLRAVPTFLLICASRYPM